MKIKTQLTLAVLGIILLIGIICFAKSFAWNEAGESFVTQDLGGKLHVRLEAGPSFILLGDRKVYRDFATVGFGSKEGEGAADVGAVSVIFNDASRAGISLLARVELPQDPEKMKLIRQKFAGGYEHFIRSGVVPVIANIIKLSANLRSSQEAYTTLAIFQKDIEDQLRNGRYVTQSVEKWVVKATGDSERVKLTEIVPGDNGLPKCVEHDLMVLGCKVQIQELEVPEFDQKTVEMIGRRKDESLQTELRRQEAIRAEQEAITAEKMGKAAAMKVKWAAEEVKAKAVTEAEMERDVANLEVDKAIAYKKAKILRAEADAEYKRKIMQADGALEKKLDAYVQIHANYATALTQIKGDLVPKIQYIGSGSESNGSAMDLTRKVSTMVDLNIAKELGLDLGITKK